MQDDQDWMDPKDMTPELAYAEALRRIEAAVESGQDWLDLGDLPLAAIPQEIARLARQLRQLGLDTSGYDAQQADWTYIEERRSTSRSIKDLRPLAGLAALQILNISGCDQITSLNPIAGLTALQSLAVVRCNQITSLDPIASIATLQSLHVIECNHGMLLDPIARLTSLQSLYLSGFDQITSLDPITDLTSLQSLGLGCCKRLTSLAPIAGLTALQSLHVTQCDQVTSLDPIAGLTTLQSLNLQWCKQLTSLDPIAGLTALQSLRVGWCDLLTSLAPIACLTALRALYIDGCDQVTSLDPIAGLTSLQSLSVNGHITSLDPIAGLTALQSLWVSGHITSLDPIAGLTALQSLHVSGCHQITSLDPISGLTALQSLCVSSCSHIKSIDPIAGLTALKSLQVHACWQLISLDPISGLTALHSLEVSMCDQITSLDPIAGLTALHSLDVSGCKQLTSLDPIAGLTALEKLRFSDVPSAQTLRVDALLQQWPKLSMLVTDRLHAVPPEVLSSNRSSNCLPYLRSWWHDLQQGEVDSHEIKLFVLGNGGVGKSELFGRLRGDDFHGKLPSTHGIQLGHFELCRHHDDRPTFLNAWDFGGQDIYLGTHALFLKSRAIFVLAWHPAMETDAPYTEAVSGLEMRHRPLQYWLDYIHSLAGDEARVIVVQTQCARESDEAAPPLRDTSRLAWYRETISCASQEDGVDSLRDLLKRAARHRLEMPAPPRMPASWLAVRDQLGTLRETERTIDRTRFDAICADTHHGASSEALLHYLHQAGDVFHESGLFGDAIVLDQQWALDGIYTLFDRGRVLPLLRGHNGLFAPEMLDALAWNGHYSEKEQALLLSMMESCDLIFPIHQWGETRYYAMIDALPDAVASANRIAMVWPAGAQAIEAVAEYAFLHDGVLRALLARIGRLAGRDAVYWRHGVCLYDARTASRARIDTEQRADGSGYVRMRTAGRDADALCERLIALLEEIRIGATPDITRNDVSARSSFPHPPSERDLPMLQPAPIPPLPGQKPVVYISYAWGTQDNDGRRPLQEFAIRLQRSLEAEFDVRRDQEAMLPGDSLEAFMREIGRGTRVLVLLSEAYVYSRNCMKELENLNARNQSDPDQLRRCALPLIVDTSFSLSDDKRIGYVDHWVAEAERLRQSLGKRDPTRHLSVLKNIKTVEKIADTADEMLAFMNDILMPRGMPCLSEDDFATVKASLHRLPGA
jgi:internalin A